MTTVYKGYFSGFDVNNSCKHCDKEALFIVFADFSVNCFYHFFRWHYRLSNIINQRFCCHHKQSCRNAFAGNIRNKEHKVVIINEIKIIKIAADFFCRLHSCINVKFFSVGKGRKNIRKTWCLNFFCQW